ncbi:MAG: M18 family aminopeptidase [Bacteroides sp.]|nr:M18 family aminopeptidase [Bacteroides sp.]MCM1378955.1 M18 family aminopeptidase [Bacteroides sp.]MCM1445571.1 M18 family aminopeptidase [Prevotella sp.]
MDNQRFFKFMDSAVSNFTAVQVIAEMLEGAGFVRLSERNADWQLAPGSRGYVIKNDSAIFAFIVGDSPECHIIAAHSDSPTFRLKPNPEIAVGACSSGNDLMVKLNTEVYGGAIWASWFDRPLGMSGRVVMSDLSTRIVRLDNPKLIIPRLAIHFNREVNKGVGLSAQKDMLPILGYVSRELGGTGAVNRLLANKLEVLPEDILDFDITLFDAQGAEAVGSDSSWVNCGRLDDLAMAWCAIEALLQNADSQREYTRVAAIFDNEETGSGTRQGAHSPVLRNILRRISLAAFNASEQEFLASLARSFFISADCAHAAHPNYLEKMDPVNLPRLGGGPVIKVNANCKYMTDALSAARFKKLCAEAGVPYQEFVNHSDSPGGSTLGNILTSTLDIDGVDMGIALWAMHSARETASLHDIDLTIRAFARFL